MTTEKQTKQGVFRKTFARYSAADDLLHWWEKAILVAVFLLAVYGALKL